MVEGIRAVIFDFDGLLMDTESTSIDSWAREWSRWGVSLDRSKFFVPHGGDVNEERYGALAAAVGPSFDRAASHRRRQADRNTLNQALDLASGISEWLDECAESGLRTAVASSSEVTWVEQHLGRVGARDKFELIAGGDLVASHKPAPDVYLLALHRLELDPSQAVAVEDTAHGVDAAHAAGIRCIAIPNPYLPKEAVSHADLVLSSAAELSLARAIASL